MDSRGIGGGNGTATLAEVAEEAWCQYPASTLERYSREPFKTDMEFPDPAVAKKGKAKARWSLVDMRVWCDSRRAPDPGEPGVYVVGLSHETDVKIGETKRLTGRLDELGYGTFDQGEVVQWWFPCRDKRHAKALEGWFRAKYGALRIGESERHRKEGQLLEDLGDRDRMLKGCPAELLPVEVNV